MKPNRFTYRLFVNRPLKRLTVQKLRVLDEGLLPKYQTIATYPCAIGSLGYETPGGVYKIWSKMLNPPWWVPNSPWAIEAGLTPYDVIPGGDERNPLKGAFLQFTKTDPTGNVGIHGTANVDSLGTAASHGCVRVTEGVAVHLFRTIPKYTRVEVL